MGCELHPVIFCCYFFYCGRVGVQVEPLPSLLMHLIHSKFTLHGFFSVFLFLVNRFFMGPIALFAYYRISTLNCCYISTSVFLCLDRLFAIFRFFLNSLVE